MTLDGTYTFNAPRQRVWQILMDPAAISACIPGCTLVPTGEDQYEATITSAALGGGSGTIAMLDKVEPESYRLVMKARVPYGSATGESRVSLSEQGSTTVVSMSSTLEVGGMMAMAGGRMIAGPAKMMLDRFFACLAAKA